LPYQAFKTGPNGANFAKVSSSSWGTGNGNLRGDFVVTGIRTAYFSAGDFNFDGTVDSQDYELWRSSYGRTSTAYPVIAADGNRDGTVDGSDFLLWRHSTASASGTMSAAVPEPGAWFVFCAALLGAVLLRTRHLAKF
jgi:hypothetical protein